jgi:cytochrome P450
MLSIILAAGETTAGTMCWAVKFLARHPEVQRKLRTELQDAGLEEREICLRRNFLVSLSSSYPSTPLLTADLIDLEATAREVLRLCGIIGGPVRNAMQDTTILGKAIPKGTLIYIPLHLVATLPVQDTAKDPDSVAHLDDRWAKYPLGEFDPERWLQEGRFDEDAGAQVMPFSAGPRGCFGKPLAVSRILAQAERDISDVIWADAGDQDNVGQTELGILP